MEPAAPNMLKTGGPQQHALLAMAGTMEVSALNEAPSMVLVSSFVGVSFRLSPFSMEDDCGCCPIRAMRLVLTSNGTFGLGSAIALFYATISSMWLIFAVASSSCVDNKAAIYELMSREPRNLR